MELYASVLENGDLEITLHEDFREEMEELAEEKDDILILIEGFEHYFANGSYHPFDAGEGNPFVGLSSDICIAESMDVNDEGECEIVGAFWHYPDTYRYDVVEQLLQHGKVIFKLVN